MNSIIIHFFGWFTATLAILCITTYKKRPVLTGRQYSGLDPSTSALCASAQDDTVVSLVQRMLLAESHDFFADLLESSIVVLSLDSAVDD